MSSSSRPIVQARTPRKRKADQLPLSPPPTRRRAAPAPNPPSAPFPPTPTSRHRKNVDEDELDLLATVTKASVLKEPSTVKRGSARLNDPSTATQKSADLSSEPSTVTKAASRSRVKLPDHLQTLLTLHHAFNIAVSLHLATQPPVLPPHSADATSVRLPNLTNLLSIKGAVERGSGRRFGQTELSRLAWLYAWDGEALPADDKEDDDNPFLEKPKSNPSEPVSGLSYLFTATRTLDPAGRKVHTLGVGLELDIEKGETRQLLMNGAEGGFGNKGQGGGLRVLARWNAGAEMREDTVRERLEKWVLLNGGELEAVEETYLPTPSTRDSGRSSIPPIPLLPLPKLPTSSLGASLFAASPLAAEAGPSTTPKKPPAFELSDPFELPVPKPPSTPKGSLEARRQAMLDRIKAKSASAKAARTPLATSINSGSDIFALPRQSQQEALKRRSTLSRLEGIAESVWMMFSSVGTGSPSSSLLTPSRRRKAINLHEATELIVKSSKTPISAAEAQDSVRLLAELCPFFLACKLVGRQEWIELVAQPLLPPSPGGGEVAGGSPRTPGRSARLELAGPGSPGRVQVGGLRAVRERIRRELGE